MSTAAYRPIAPITHQRNISPQPLTALFFDPVSDTLWAGTNAGNAVAYYTPRGMRGVSFRVGGTLAVNNVLADENYVFASGVDSNGVGAWTKGGVNKWYHRCVSLRLRAMEVLFWMLINVKVSFVCDCGLQYAWPFENPCRRYVGSRLFNSKCNHRKPYTPNLCSFSHHPATLLSQFSSRWLFRWLRAMF